MKKIEKKNSYKLTNNQRNELYKYIQDHPADSYGAIAKKYGVSRSWVSDTARTKFGRENRRDLVCFKKWTGEAIDNYLRDKKSTIRRLTTKFKNVKSRMKWGVPIHISKSVFDILPTNKFGGF